jgi:rSAM/selenodomain-associated transferase 2
MVSIIVPTLNEASHIAATLDALANLRGEKEIIVVDGDSDDDTAQLAGERGATVLSSPRGRGIQLHTGALHSSGDILWFVHADTRPPAHALDEISLALTDPAIAGGNFGLTFDGGSRAARQLTAIYPLLRALNLCYGDSGIFVRRSAYDATGGFRPFALFEDLDLLKRLRRMGRFVHLQCRIITSSRRFEQRNFALIWMHWTALQVLYWGGVSPNVLARWYRSAPCSRGSETRVHPPAGF